VHVTAKIFSAVVVLSVLVAPLTSWAKDLSRRLGIGYSNQFSEELPSLSARYWVDGKFGVGAAVGVDTEDGSSAFGAMLKIYRNIFTEDNLNFYMGSGAGLISKEKQQASGGKDTDSGFELLGFVGAEFFLPGLESLGLSFEAGFGVTSISSQVRFRTIGDHPLRAGMLFYF
jgi:hypothetical protein